jgi:serine/threonine-protein kinase
MMVPENECRFFHSQQRGVMDRDRWTTIKRIFGEAIEVSPSERCDCVRRLGGDDEVLIEEVLSLIRSSESSGGFLDTPASPLPGGSKPDLEGATISNYFIHRRLGQGGMGAVYLASRKDGVHEQKVALKVLQNHYQPSMLQRFHQERRILAQLEHPGIARLLDGGDLSNGHPFYVMEYVEGVAIDEYCRYNGLDVSQILGLFMDVCHAVHYAHQNLIVHRDIKPGNILVTNKGQIKLLDFGIAKLLTTDNPESVSDATVMQQSMVTPSYASPEQVMLKPAGTSSDIYSLGVLLYRLLTEQLPYQLEDEAPHTLTHAICTQEPKAPSEIAGGKRRLLKGDLDNIVLMALRKEASRRYASAEAFAEDIGNYLNDYPVNATPDNLSYQIRKFVRRNMVGVLAAGIVSLLILGFAVHIYLQNDKIRLQAELTETERDAALKAQALAEQEKATAEAAVRFMQEMFTSVDPGKTKGKEVTAREILENASIKLRKEGVLKDQPQVKSTLHHTLGLTYMQLGDYPLAELHQKSALKLRREVLGDDDPETLRAMNLLGILYFRQGRLRETEKLWTEALQTRRRVLGAEAHRTLSSMSNLAILYIRMNKSALAEDMLQRTLEIERRVLGKTHPETLTTQNNLAGFLNERGRYRASEELHRATLQARMESLGADHPDTLQSEYNIGLLLMDQNRYQQAVDQFRKTLADRQKVLGATHPKTVRTRLMMAQALEKTGAYSEAKSHFEQSLEVLSRRSSASDEDLARTELYYGLMLQEQAQGDKYRAESLIRSAWNRSHEEGEPHPLATESALGMARLALAWDQPGKALKLIVDAETISLKEHGLEYPDTLAARRMRIETLLLLGKKDRILPLAEEWLDASISFYGKDHPNTKYAREIRYAL